MNGINLPKGRELFNICLLNPWRLWVWMMAHIDCIKLNKITSSVLCLSPPSTFDRLCKFQLSWRLLEYFESSHLRNSRYCHSELGYYLLVSKENINMWRELFWICTSKSHCQAILQTFATVEFLLSLLSNSPSSLLNCSSNIWRFEHIIRFCSQKSIVLPVCRFSVGLCCKFHNGL